MVFEEESWNQFKLFGLGQDFLKLSKTKIFLRKILYLYIILYVFLYFIFSSKKIKFRWAALIFASLNKIQKIITKTKKKNTCK